MEYTTKTTIRQALIREHTIEWVHRVNYRSDVETLIVTYAPPCPFGDLT